MRISVVAKTQNSYFRITALKVEENNPFNNIQKLCNIMRKRFCIFAYIAYDERAFGVDHSVGLK